MMLTAAELIAQELKLSLSQVQSIIDLLDEGSTVPFIARYRKEVTGGVDDTQLRHLHERLSYLRELHNRRDVIIKTIKEQGKLTDTLEQSLLAADTKMRLEDLYLPYRPKRQSKALQAIQSGLEPLADRLLDMGEDTPEHLAESFVNPELNVPDTKTALEGARHILMERFAENADLLTELRNFCWKHGTIISKGIKKASTTSKKKNNKKDNASKFSDYFEYSEAIHKIPSHRALALFRGRREGVLQISLNLPESMQSHGEEQIAKCYEINFDTSPIGLWLQETIRLTWKVKIFTKLELELMTQLRELADNDAILVFARNLSDLLLAAPAGAKVTMGLDPGIRTGVKAVVIDETGKLLDYTTVFPLQPQNDWHQSIAALAKLAARYNVSLVSIGNGTGSRETERLVTEMMKMYPDLPMLKVLVNEAGASVYSASELAALEFPDLDVTYRGAVSIARRLQDPLPELVKIEAKAIGVGQYQHDVNQTKLARCLDGVVEDCVNAVGVDLNTASVPLLSCVSGLNQGLAKNIVEYRNEHGAFSNRDTLKEVARMGAKSFQQAAGFLRIMNGNNPLDASCVHPESYAIVEKILADLNQNIIDVIGNKELMKSINLQQYISDEYGIPTLQDILKELEKPGRDPRPEFRMVQFKDGVEDIKDLEEGMILEGVVGNVTNFGAFIDVGVHQDGLVHISEMTNKFISDPSQIVKAGDIVTVKVIEINKDRKRISLSMKIKDESSAPKKPQTKPPVKAKPQRKEQKPVKAKAAPSQTKVFNTTMADALSKLKNRST